MNKLLPILLAFVLSGCATPQGAVEHYLSNGQKVFSITCGNMMGDVNNCYDYMGSHCKEKGYRTYSVDNVKDGWGTIIRQRILYDCK